MKKKIFLTLASVMILSLFSTPAFANSSFAEEDISSSVTQNYFYLDEDITELLFSTGEFDWNLFWALVADDTILVPDGFFEINPNTHIEERISANIGRIHLSQNGNNVIVNYVGASTHIRRTEGEIAIAHLSGRMQLHDFEFVVSGLYARTRSFHFFDWSSAGVVWARAHHVDGLTSNFTPISAWNISRD